MVAGYVCTVDLMVVRIQSIQIVWATRMYHVYYMLHLNRYLYRNWYLVPGMYVVFHLKCYTLEGFQHRYGGVTPSGIGDGSLRQPSPTNHKKNRRHLSGQSSPSSGSGPGKLSQRYHIRVGSPWWYPALARLFCPRFRSSNALWSRPQPGPK